MSISGPAKEGSSATADGEEITAAALSPDGRFAAAAPKGKAVMLLGLEDGTARVELKEAKGRISVLEFSGDGRYLAAGGDKKDIVIWEVPSGQLRSTLKGHDGGILAIAFHEAERSVISAGRDGKMIVWDAAAAKPLRQYDLEARTIADSGIDVTAARISTDRLYAAVAVEEHVLQKGGQGMIFKYHLAFFDVSKGVLLKILESNRRRIDHIGLYPGNCFAAFDNSTLQEYSIALRNIESGSLDLAYPMKSECGLLEFSPDGRWLAGAAAPSKGESEARLNLWKVDYEIPASGCFMGRIRLASGGGPVLKAGGAPRIAAVLPFSDGRGRGGSRSGRGEFHGERAFVQSEPEADREGAGRRYHRGARAAEERTRGQEQGGEGGKAAGRGAHDHREHRPRRGGSCRIGEGDRRSRPARSSAPGRFTAANAGPTISSTRSPSWLRRWWRSERDEDGASGDEALLRFRFELQKERGEFFGIGKIRFGGSHERAPFVAIADAGEPVLDLGDR